jgi:hypothetical protein
MKKLNKTHIKFLKFIVEHEHESKYKDGFTFYDIIENIWENGKRRLNFYRPTYIMFDLEDLKYVTSMSKSNPKLRLTKAGREFIKSIKF